MQSAIAYSGVTVIMLLSDLVVYIYMVALTLICSYMLLAIKYLTISHYYK